MEQTIWTIREREPRTSISTFTQPPSSDVVLVQCCFTLLLVTMVLNVLRNVVVSN